MALHRCDRAGLPAIGIFICVWTLVLLALWRFHYWTLASRHANRAEVELVMAKMKNEDTQWVHQHLPEWPRSIYIVDDPAADLAVPANKGREAMVILT